MGSWLLVLAVAAIGAGAWLGLRRRLERVARATHELRAPLCAARLALHAAGRDVGWVALAPADHELGRAALALDDLEAARNGRAPRSSRRGVDPVALLEAVHRSWAPLAWPVGRDLRVDPGGRLPCVEGDERRLAQAIGNLVGNALEHGAGPVVLRARTAGATVRIEVVDDGPGPAVALRRLTRRRRGGRGARGRGLAIAAQVARRHRGRLLHERDEGGCRMVLELPAAGGQRLGAVPAPVPASASRDPLLDGVRFGGVARLRLRRSA